MINTREVNIFASQLYATSGSGSNKGVNTVGTSLPTSNSSPPTTNVPFALGPASASPYGIFLTQLNPSSPGIDTAYVADDGTGGGIEKFSLVAGNWVANGVIGTGRTLIAA